MYSFMSAYQYFDSLQKIIKLFHQLSGATFGLRFFFWGKPPGRGNRTVGSRTAPPRQRGGSRTSAEIGHAPKSEGRDRSDGKGALTVRRERSDGKGAHTVRRRVRLRGGMEHEAFRQRGGEVGWPRPSINQIKKPATGRQLAAGQ